MDIGAYEIGLAKVLDIIIKSMNNGPPEFRFNTVDGSGLQIRTVPVPGANKVCIRFSEDVTNVASGSLAMQSLQTGAVFQPTNVTYSSTTNLYTWQFASVFVANQYRLSISDSVTNRNDNALDGEWTNPFSVTTVDGAVSEFPSGNGQAGGAFNFAMTFLPGDANLSNNVDGVDYLIWQANFGGGGGFTKGDFNGNGQVDYPDYMIWNNNFGRALFSLVLADFNHDNAVNNLDFLIWQSNFGLTGATHAEGDADLDGDVDNNDLQIWQNQNFLQLVWVA